MPMTPTREQLFMALSMTISGLGIMKLHAMEERWRCVGQVENPVSPAVCARLKFKFSPPVCCSAAQREGTPYLAKSLSRSGAVCRAACAEHADAGKQEAA